MTSMTMHLLKMKTTIKIASQQQQSSPSRKVPAKHQRACPIKRHIQPLPPCPQPREVGRAPGHPTRKPRHAKYSTPLVCQLEHCRLAPHCCHRPQVLVHKWRGCKGTRPLGLTVEHLCQIPLCRGGDEDYGGEPSHWCAHTPNTRTPCCSATWASGGRGLSTFAQQSPNA